MIEARAAVAAWPAAGDWSPADRDDLASTIVELRLLDPRPLVVNAWKRTATVAGWQAPEGVAAGGCAAALRRSVVLKWRAPSAAPRVVAWSEAERRAYLEPGWPALQVELLASGPRWLLLEAVAGRSVLDALEAALGDGEAAAPTSAAGVAAISRRWLAPVVAAILRTSRPATDGGQDDGAGVRDVVAGLGRSLARSGPMRTERRPASAALGVAIERLTGPALQRLVRARPALLRRGWAHGDLHLDNLWLGDDGRVLVLDLATARPDGLPLLDLVYALTATRARLGGHAAIDRAVRRAALEELAALPAGEVAAVGATVDDLVRVARTNPRFSPDLGAIERLGARVGTPFRLAARAARGARA